MTKEEAVARIKDHIEIHRYHERNAVKIFEALDMAIKALEQPDRSLWFRIGEICVDESKGFISAGRAVEKIRELLRESERRTDE